MKPIRTWILIADSAHVRVLLNEGPGKGLRQISGDDIGLPHAEKPGVVADRPGRVHESYGTTRHAIDANTSPADKSRLSFARQIASNLEANSELFDRLIIVAAPQALGTLRNVISAGVEEKIHAAIPKDLTGTPNDKIADLLSDAIAI
ncbi:MAG: host attachment protein [Hyphomicrobiaceae bacterium]